MNETMRMFGPLIIFGFMLVTWFLWHPEGNTRPGIRVHNDIQVGIENLIHNQIKEKFPEFSDLTIEKLVTKNLDENNIRADFKFSFKNQDGPHVISEDKYGVAQVTRAHDKSNEWKINKVQFSKESIDFETGILIQSRSKN